MHSMCIRKMMFVFELFIITDEKTFILAVRAIKSGPYDQTFVDQTKKIDSDC